MLKHRLFRSNLSHDTPFVTLALATQQQSGAEDCSTGIESELAFARDFAITFALAELSDLLIT